ncbi:hypothetical protein [Pontibacter russatus]|uniref:hypothetical protein n=1 Tax=Pontibacter russatus TaxID=2694929 RepID=UPI00137B0552|nr:hypothetical protein [Pontibacter russatus]
MRKVLLLLVVLAGFVSGCEEKYPDPKAMGYAYYPLEIGAYRIYEVTDIKFRDNVGDTLHFQLQERVDTSFYDQTNTLSYKVVRSTRPDENSAWVEDSVMVVWQVENSLLLTKDNSTFVKLVFPVSNGKTWAGDAFNTRAVNKGEKETYAYTQVGEPYEVNGQVFPITATVIQGTPVKNLVYLDNRKEVYAEGVGRVYRLFNRVVYCNQTSGSVCEFGADYKLDGHERHEELISYGKM